MEEMQRLFTDNTTPPSLPKPKPQTKKHCASVEKVKAIESRNGIMKRVRQLTRTQWENGDPIPQTYVDAVFRRLLCLHQHQQKKGKAPAAPRPKKHQKMPTAADKIQTLYMFHKLDLGSRQQQFFRRFTKMFQSFATAAEISKLVKDISAHYQTKFVPEKFGKRDGHAVKLSGAIDLAINIVKCFQQEPENSFPEQEHANMNSKLKKLKATFSELKAILGSNCTVVEKDQTPTVYKKNSDFTSTFRILELIFQSQSKLQWMVEKLGTTIKWYSGLFLS
jgi:hypothetical protein